MHYVKIPKFITPINGATRKPIPNAVETPYEDWLRNNPLRDKRFRVDMKGLIAADKLDELFTGCKEGDVVPVEDADWETLKAACESPQQDREVGFADTLLAKQYLPYMRSIVNASEEDPRAELEG